MYYLPGNGDRGSRISLSSRPTSCIKRVPGLPELLHRETCLETPKWGSVWGKKEICTTCLLSKKKINCFAFIWRLNTYRLMYLYANQEAGKFCHLKELLMQTHCYHILGYILFLRMPLIELSIYNLCNLIPSLLSVCEICPVNCINACHLNTEWYFSVWTQLFSNNLVLYFRFSCFNFLGLFYVYVLFVCMDLTDLCVWCP